MYGGVGRPTPRGTGTSGHVQKSLAYVPQKMMGSGGPRAGDAKARTRVFNKDIARHEKLRSMESRILEKTEEFEERGYDEAKIKREIALYRERLLHRLEYGLKEDERLHNRRSEKMQHLEQREERWKKRREDRRNEMEERANELERGGRDKEVVPEKEENEEAGTPPREEEVHVSEQADERADEQSVNNEERESGDIAAEKDSDGEKTPTVDEEGEDGHDRGERRSRRHRHSGHSHRHSHSPSHERRRHRHDRHKRRRSDRDSSEEYEKEDRHRRKRRRSRDRDEYSD